METMEAFETQEMVGALAWPSNDEVCRADSAKTCDSALQLHSSTRTENLRDDTIAAKPLSEKLLLLLTLKLSALR